MKSELTKACHSLGKMMEHFFDCEFKLFKKAMQNSCSLPVIFIFHVLCPFLLFRAPMVGDLRIQWIDAILAHQQYDTFSIGFMICELHFPAEDLFVENRRKILRRDAVPSIFDIKPMINYQTISSTGNRPLCHSDVEL